MTIRNMVLEDYCEFNRLMKQVHKIHVEGRPDLYIDVECIYSYDQFKNMVENNDIITILAEVEEETAGICIISMREKTCMVKMRTAYMDDLCVDVKYRGMGIGKELFYHAKKKAMEMGAKRLDLMVWDFNENAKRFYEKNGMKPQRYIYETEL